MPVIDFHNHFYPAAYLDALRAGASRVQVTIDDQGNPRLHYPGDYNIAVRGHRDIAYRTSVLEEFGVDTQVLSLTTPGTHVEEPLLAVNLARLVNDGFASIVANGRGRYVGIATLLLSDPSSSAIELRRAHEELHFAGADHILAGSDYPHQIGSLRRMLDSIAALDISEDDREKILGRNAARLL